MKNKETETKPELDSVLDVVYSIRYGEYPCSGSIEKLAKSKEAIINLVKNDEYIQSGKGIISVTVDFDDEKVYYDYTDWCDETEQGVLYLTKLEVVGLIIMKT